MTFVLYPRRGKARRLRMAEARTWLSQEQIARASRIKAQDPMQDVTFTVRGGSYIEVC